VRYTATHSAMVLVDRTRAVAVPAAGVHRYHMDADAYVSPQWCGSPASCVAPTFVPAVARSPTW
jgi:hypothetical protein